jgi:hypothetical protein
LIDKGKGGHRSSLIENPNNEMIFFGNEEGDALP